MATQQQSTDTIEATDGGELSRFQWEILYILADAGPEYGLGIKRALEDRYGEEVNHGRLYPNLDTLVDAGYVEKDQRDLRTNDYALTDQGADLLYDDASRRSTIAAGMEGGDA